MTTLSITTSNPATAAANALIVLVQPGRKISVASAGITPALSRKIADAVQAVGGSGKAGETHTLGPITGIRASRIVAAGIGSDRDDTEAVRRALGNAVRACAGERKVAIALPDDADLLEPIATGARLAAYAFTAFKSKPKPTSKPVEAIVLVVPNVDAAMREIVNAVSVIADSVDLARDLVNTPPNALFPAVFAQRAKEAVEGLPVKVQIWDEKALRRDGCGGILGVGQGSSNPPRLVKLVYAPKEASYCLAFVGKGITFDTGGISIKPAADMHEMKSDMGGAAAVLGGMQAIAALGLPVCVTAWIPLAENMPSGNAQRPGDVITMANDSTVEVLNTDAEGRLVLADALVLAAREEPDLIVDAATLTGAQRVALGARIAGVMANDDDARSTVVQAGARAGETLWPMPLPEDMRADLDSATADIANIGGRLGGMLTAGIFMQTFIPEDQPWVHVDIAGPAYNAKGAYGYTPTGGTGAMVRTFVTLARECAAD
jgi:leucyl aminopeptidase